MNSDQQIVARGADSCPSFLAVQIFFITRALVPQSRSSSLQAGPSWSREKVSCHQASHCYGGSNNFEILLEHHLS